MSTGDFQFYTEGPFGNPGSKRYRVLLSASAPTINPGEPVSKARGTSGTVVATLATNKPLVGTDFLAGISQSVSTETTTAEGVVDVYDIFAEGNTFLVAPNVAATWNTQAKYNALVGSRVLLDKTSGAYTVLATDNANNGVVVEPLDVAKYPGKVRVAFRKALYYLA